MTKKIIVVSVAALIIIGMVGYVIYNNMFPVAEEFKLLNSGDITYASVYTEERGEVEQPESEIPYLVAHMNIAEPTRIPSVSDRPIEEIDHMVTVEMNGEIVKYYFYEKGDDMYMDSPDEGVYRVDEVMLGVEE